MSLWNSKRDTVHSQALITNPTMSVTLYDTANQFGFYAVGAGELIEEKADGYGRYRFTAVQTWINDDTYVKREVHLQ